VSALWIAGYLATVILGASIAVVAFLRLELWLQSRRIRSRRRQHRLRLSVGAGSESVLAVAEDSDIGSPGGNKPALSVSSSTPVPAQVRARQDTSSEQTTLTGAVGTGLAEESPVSNDNVKSSRATKAPGHQSTAVPSTPASTSKAAAKPGNPSDLEARNGESSRGNGGRARNGSSQGRQAQYVVPSATLDDLYDREVATVISSELVDEDEREQELSPEDMIEADVL